MIRAKLILSGYYASGQGAHEAEVSFLKKLNFQEDDIRFMNEIRNYRNKSLYYGKGFNIDYAKKVVKFHNKLYPKLLSIIETEYK